MCGWRDRTHTHQRPHSFRKNFYVLEFPLLDILKLFIVKSLHKFLGHIRVQHKQTNHLWLAALSKTFYNRYNEIIVNIKLCSSMWKVQICCSSPVELFVPSNDACSNLLGLFKGISTAHKNYIAWKLSSYKTSSMIWFVYIGSEQSIDTAHV